MQENIQTPQNGLSQELLSNLPPEMLAEIISNALQGKTENTHTHKISLDQLIEYHERYTRAEDFSESSIFQCTAAYKYLRRFAERRGLTSPDEFRRDHADEFRYELKEDVGFSGRHIGPTYQISLYKRVKAVFAFAETNEYIIKNPFKNINFPLREVGKVWTRSYTNKVINGLKKYYKGYKLEWAICTILGGRYCGQRSGLWNTLRVKDIHYIEETDRLYFTIRGKIPHSRGLTRYTREVKHTPTKTQILKVLKMAKEMGKTHDDLLTHWCTARVGYEGVRKMVVDTCEKENLEYMPLHGTKRGCITEIGEAGGTAEEACLFVGNRTVEVVRKRYMVFNLDKVSTKVGDIFEKNDRES